MAEEPRFTALVLAGSRRGEADSVARYCRVRHKSLAPAGGRPMLARVVEALQAAHGIGPVLVCAESPMLLDSLGLDVTFVAARGSPGESVAAVLAERPGTTPILVTTADHPLLTATMVEAFCASAASLDADLAIGVASADTILASYPQSVRTFWRFRGGGYSGANLFALLTPRALVAITFWRQAEADRKRPWRVALTLGLGNLARYLLRRSTLEETLERLSQRLGVRIRPVVLPFAEAAIDVDKPADLDLVNAILARRAASAQS